MQAGAGDKPKPPGTDPGAAATATAGARRFKVLSAFLLLVIIVYVAFHFLGLRLTSEDESEPGQPNFPPGGPAEFLYLDGSRVASYLAQVDGGSYDQEKVARKLTDTAGLKLATAGLGEASGTRARETFVERVLQPTEASEFFALKAGLDDQHDIKPIKPADFASEAEQLHEGEFVSFRSSALLSPIYLNAYLAIRGAHTLASIFPESMPRRRAARAFFEEVGRNPRATFSLRPRDATQSKFAAAEDLPTFLLPIGLRGLSAERSLLKYGGGRFTVVGKVVRLFPEGDHDRSPAYVDSPTLEAWAVPLRRAPGELLCRTEPRCLRAIREADLPPAKRGGLIEAARERILAALNEQSEIDRRGAVILPIAIYK